MMKRLVIGFCLLLGFIVAPAFAATRVTVDQLTSEIAAAKGQDDTKVATHLQSIELTERLSKAKFAEMQAALPGPVSRQALYVLAEQSAFLSPPAAEIPANAAPGVPEQRATLAKTVEYVRLMQLRIPDLIADRDTIHFDASPRLPGNPEGSGSAQQLHAVSRNTSTISYRGGKDFVQVAGKEGPASALSTRGLTSFGEFGPLLSNVLVDLPKGKLAWSHWEQSESAPVAVFSFSVPKADSHYAVKFCCIGRQPIQQISGYHGELTIDPSSGIVLRLALFADLAADDPITKADLIVEYAPIELGGRTYFCPARSIALSLVEGRATSAGASSPVANGPKQIMLNEVAFVHYHLAQSESQAQTADAPESSALNSQTTEASSSVAPSPAPSPVPPANAATTIPEINVTPQKTPFLPDAPANTAQFALRVTTRIVDVSVAAFDRKGHPVSDLTREDFQIFDGARKQTLRSFTRAVDASGATPDATPQSAHANTEFSNRGEAAPSATAQTGKAAANVTIVFFDATSLQFNDLTNSREQFLKIVGTLPASEQVGLYVRVGFGFRVLLEPTTDRAALTASLRDWSPTAADMARAQEAEERNRQQFDSLRSPSAANSTYAMVDSNSGAGQMIGSDPRLFTLGEQPTRQALTVLVAVGTHMGVMPGHKNLVWIASDNVLADWSETAAGDEGRMSPNSIGQYSARTQEALNNAHVSLYPFDASQLGTAATEASLENPGVDLDAAEKSNKNYKPPPGGRSLTELRTQTRPVQIAIQQLAESTGGRSFGRSSNVLANLNSVIEDSNAVYLLSFAPDTPPDDKYHELKVTLPARHDIKLRYRTGYLYSKEPASLKERFAQVLWQPFDASEIAITAHRAPATGGAAIILRIDANDLGLVQNGDRRTGKLDVFLVKRDDTGAGALVKEQSLALNLSADGYKKVMSEGIPFQQYIDQKQNGESVRMIVVDENSGRIGSITLPAEDAGSRK